MMKALKACMAVLAIGLATGCLEKPAPWVPDGLLPDAAADAETLTGDGLATGDLADVGGDVLPVDGEVQGQELSDGAGEAGDTTMADGSDMVELEVLPDTDAPEVVQPGPLLKGPSFCPGIGGAWGTRPYRAWVSWHRNVLVKED